MGESFRGREPGSVAHAAAKPEDSPDSCGCCVPARVPCLIYCRKAAVCMQVPADECSCAKANVFDMQHVAHRLHTQFSIYTLQHLTQGTRIIRRIENGANWRCRVLDMHCKPHCNLFRDLHKAHIIAALQLLHAILQTGRHCKKTLGAIQHVQTLQLLPTHYNALSPPHMSLRRASVTTATPRPWRYRTLTPVHQGLQQRRAAGRAPLHTAQCRRAHRLQVLCVSRRLQRAT